MSTMNYANIRWVVLMYLCIAMQVEDARTAMLIYRKAKKAWEASLPQHSKKGHHEKKEAAQ